MGQILLEAVLHHVGRQGNYWSLPQGIAKGKLRLTTQEVFCNGVTASVNKGKATDDIYPDFCKTFDTTLLTLNCTGMGSTEGLLDG